MNQNNFSGTHEDSSHQIEQEDNRQERGQLSRVTPLVFRLRINGSYYISYKQGQFWPMLVRSVLWAVVNILLIAFLRSFQDVDDSLKKGIEFGLISQVVLHFIICFLDAGTIFEDEQDTYKDQRIYCVTCSLYRLRGSKHCLYCNRCVRTYDHHCGVFGKCIGRRNLVPFWLFIIVSGLQMPAFIVVLVTQSFSSS